MSEHFQEFFLHILLQLAVIISAARIGAWLLGKLGQPQVVGEIVAGLVLGPSVLGRFEPQVLEYLFPNDATIVFRALSELGLVLLMFLIGLEFEFKHLRKVGKTASAVAAAGIALPFLLGVALAMWMHTLLAIDANRGGFVLIVAVSMSITAIPILGRIMIELNIQRTPLGTLTITAAAIDDALGWILLAAVSAMIHGGFEFWGIARMTLLTIGFVAACLFVARPVLRSGADTLMTLGNGDLSVVGLSAVLVTVFMAAAATNVIGIFSIFGPFVLGAVLSDHHDFREAVGRKLREMVHALFLPIFFTYTGLRTNVGLLETSRDWMLCGLVVAASMTGKIFGCGAAARLGGLSWRDCGCVAVMMNTRALMGLIAINVGRELGVVPDQVFSMLVIMAVATTLLTMPALRLLLTDRP
ncbi:MAG: cation:proton antiporter [Planctomycetales bacterium]|nr:cation:proton antiporter [Planctomycetales bacterium]